MPRSQSHLVAIVMVALTASSVPAQEGRSTIPELVARFRQPLVRSLSVPSGVPPTLASVLAQTDAVVRGRVGQGSSHLTSDQTDVVTDYNLVDPIVLFSAKPVTVPNPGVTPAITKVTIPGGEIMVDGYKFVSEHAALPPLTPGAEYLFLLKQEGEAYSIAGVFLGVFEVTGGRVVPSTKKQGFATELLGVPEDGAIVAIVTKAHEVHPVK